MLSETDDDKRDSDGIPHFAFLSSKSNFDNEEDSPLYPLNISQYLKNRQLSGGRARTSQNNSKVSRSSLNTDMDIDEDRDVSEFIAKRVPNIYNECEFETKGFDKVFASVWFSKSEVIVGTKCNNLLLINVDTGKKQTIPPFPPFKSQSGAERDYSPQTSPARNNQGEPISVLNNIFQHQVRGYKQLCFGIHSIAINPSRTLMAVGAGKPTELIQVYSLPYFKPYAVLRGHQDMVFSVAWVTDFQLVSCSRDATIKTWNVNLNDNNEKSQTIYGYPIAIIKPHLSRLEHKTKVRDLKYNSSRKEAASLSGDGFVKLWDLERGDVKNSILLKQREETVCIAVDYANQLYSVGSQSHISLLDPRSGTIPIVFESLDDRWGVRSLSIERNLVTIGGGMGRISFYDIRAKDYINWIDTPRENSKPLKMHYSKTDGERIESFFTLNRRDHTYTPVPSSSDTLMNTENRLRQFTVIDTVQVKYTSIREEHKSRMQDRNYLKNGKGWLDVRDPDLNSFYQGNDINNAIYTLGYESEGFFTGGGFANKNDFSGQRLANSNRLFAAGGPLQLSLTGSYAAVWEV